MKNNSHDNLSGQLEREVMEQLWGLGKASVRQILNQLSKKRKIAYTTIMTVMTRLVEKGILKRKLINDAYIYTPIKNKVDFLSSISQQAINSMIKECGEEVAVAQLIELLGNCKLKKGGELRKKLKKIIE